MMRLRVNGEDLEFGEPLSVRGLIAELGLDRGPVAVERNGEIVPRAAHGATDLADGDVVEIVHFVGGG